MTKKFVVVCMSRNEARVWNSGTEPNSQVLVFHPPHENAEYRKEREMHEGGRFSEHFDKDYFESIVGALTGADQILFVGHGKGKANWMLLLIQYLEGKHPALASKVVDSVEADIENLTDGQVLALAREWKELNKFNN
ncbi:MAG: hypothetical protein H7227_04325 [Actinobacteria bacterium]|nr:hypothetical protein [Actinomycetota bacterium]